MCLWTNSNMPWNHILNSVDRNWELECHMKTDCNWQKYSLHRNSRSRWASLDVGFVWAMFCLKGSVRSSSFYWGFVHFVRLYCHWMNLSNRQKAQLHNLVHYLQLYESLRTYIHIVNKCKYKFLNIYGMLPFYSLNSSV